jgi:hypothetical protein
MKHHRLIAKHYFIKLLRDTDSADFQDPNYQLSPPRPFTYPYLRNRVTSGIFQ